MVGDGTWLTVGETVVRLEGLVSEQMVRRWCDDGTLESTRLPGARGDRRIKASSADALLRKLKAGPAPDQQSTEDALD